MFASANAQQWQLYQPDGQGYRVEFPGKPTQDVRHVATQAGPIELRTSALNIGDQAFFAVRSDYPTTMPMGDAETSLDRARNGSLTRSRGVLRSEERLTVGHSPARHILIDLPDSHQFADAILVVQDHYLLQVVYVGPDNARETPNARRFLSSFALVK
jgi:hypothetical protein